MYWRLLSQAGTPILALRTPTTAWLLEITEVGDPQVDSLPPKILTLHRETENSTTVDLSFGMSEAQGLFVGLSQKRPPHPNQRQMRNHMLVQSVSLVFKDYRYRQRHSPNPLWMQILALRGSITPLSYQPTMTRSWSFGTIPNQFGTQKVIKHMQCEDNTTAFSFGLLKMEPSPLNR